MKFSRPAALCVLSALLVSFGGISMTGCSSTGIAGLAAGKDPLSQLAGEWTLSQLGGSPIAGLLAGGKAPTLNFAKDGVVSGFGGVNRFGGGKVDASQLAQGNLNLGNMFSTKMAGSPEAMKLESDYLAALSNAKSFKLMDGGKGLSLTDGASELLRLVKK
jgi:heat shock protein HslJ